MGIILLHLQVKTQSTNSVPGLQAMEINMHGTSSSNLQPSKKELYSADTQTGY